MRLVLHSSACWKQDTPDHQTLETRRASEMGLEHGIGGHGSGGVAPGLVWRRRRLTLRI